jgi:hypothetical protein
MNVPVDNENLLDTVFRARIVRSDSNIAEETESHSAIPERVMAWWSHCAEGSKIRSAHRAIDTVEHATGASRRGSP